MQQTRQSKPCILYIRSFTFCGQFQAASAKRMHFVCKQAAKGRGRGSLHHCVPDTALGKCGEKNGFSANGRENTGLTTLACPPADRVFLPRQGCNPVLSHPAANLCCCAVNVGLRCAQPNLPCLHRKLFRIISKMEFDFVTFYEDGVLTVVEAHFAPISLESRRCSIEPQILIDNITVTIQSSFI